MEHTHLILTLLGFLALLLLVASAASEGWKEGEGVRYRTYRSVPSPHYQVVSSALFEASPVVRLDRGGAGREVVVWLDPAWLYGHSWSIYPQRMLFLSPSSADRNSKIAEPEE